MKHKWVVDEWEFYSETRYNCCKYGGPGGVKMLGEPILKCEVCGRLIKASAAVEENDCVGKK